MPPVGTIPSGAVRFFPSYRRRGSSTVAVVTDGPARETILRRLRLVRWLGVADTLLLLWLMYAAYVVHDRDLVRVLGPIHGAGFLLLLAIAGVSASERLWGWWFPAAILLTGGPVGALVGDWAIVRRLRREPAAAG